MDEIVNDAEISASMEEEIASVTTGWPTSQTNSKTVVPRTHVKSRPELKEGEANV
jgi:hypothetical protein